MNQFSPLVGAPLGATMFRLAVPGVIGALLFSSLGMVEAAFLKSAGADALAAVALVFPLIILAAMFSAGAIGGAVSGRTARALGAGDLQEANSVLVCAVLVSVIGGFLMCVLVLALGPLLYRQASSSETVLLAAQRYASIVFPAMPIFWLVNMLSSVMRGRGDMLRPAVIAGTLLVTYCVLAFVFIRGADSNLHDTIDAAAFTMVCSYLLAFFTAVYFIRQKDQSIRFQIKAFRWQTLSGILRQGLLASSQSMMTITYALVTTLLFSRYGTDWLAGFGLAVRLELIMVPIIFGIGASLIAIVGAYVGAGLREQAISIAWRGVLINTALVGCIGLLLALFPGFWCNLVGSDPDVIDHCSRSLRFITPTYAFFALGLGCYFASQGLDTLKFPVIGALLRLLIVTTGLFWVSATTPTSLVLLLIASAVIVYGLFVALALYRGPWALKP